MDAIEWDFRDPAAPLRDVTGGSLQLRGAGPRWTADPIVGGALRFDGERDFLVIDAAATGPLNVAEKGDRVSVIALVRRANLATGFIAGMWQEDDADPRRQYGLFVSLPTYGGAHQAIGHVSADGRPSESLPYSREYAASARMMVPGGWRVVGFTYDGAEITAYLDGIADPRPHFREIGPPMGQAREYAKNPYAYPLGLNRLNVSDFTIGAVLLSSGMGNHFAGDIARVRVVPAALDARQMLDIAAEWTPEGAPLIHVDLYRPRAGVRSVSGGADGEAWPLEALGFSSDGPVGEVRRSRLVVPAGGRPGRITLIRFPGFAAERIEAVEVEFESGIAALEIRSHHEWGSVGALSPGMQRLSLAGVGGSIHELALAVDPRDEPAVVRGLRVWAR
ncbi:hypothetical protein [Agromyces silvae]|uniref:hypothetical protein n=1 Tax=Agromyces silvae TaxID=3388266 RepID=UPI00280A7B6D|nr:hypothetical protein [Agromyces protaetiae]